MPLRTPSALLSIPSRCPLLCCVCEPTLRYCPRATWPCLPQTPLYYALIPPLSPLRRPLCDTLCGAPSRKMPPPASATPRVLFPSLPRQACPARIAFIASVCGAASCTHALRY